MSSMTDVPFVAPSEPALPIGVAPQVDDVDEVDLVEAAKLAIYATRGWTREDKNGNTVPDDDSAKAFVYGYFRDNAVVNSESDIVDDALSDSDLFAKTFPQAAGATPDAVEAEQFEAYKAVSRKLWQYAGTGIRGYCQETAEMEGLDHVMVEKKVFRASRDVSTGTGAPKQVTVRFFTSNPELIYLLSSIPATTKLVKAAEEAAKHLRMNVARHPELTNRVARNAKLALQQSNSHLAEITTGKLAPSQSADGDDN